MLVEYLGAKRNRFLSRNGAVGQNFQRELVIIRVAADTRILHGIIDVIHRRIDRVGKDRAKRNGNVLCRNGVNLLVLFLGDIPATVIEGKLHIEPNVLTNCGNVKFRIQNFNVRIRLDVSRSYNAGTGHVDDAHLRIIGVQFGSDALYVQYDLANVFFDARDRRDLVKYTVNLDVGHSNAGEGTQKNTAERVAEGNPVASLQRFNDELAVSAVL